MKEQNYQKNRKNRDRNMNRNKLRKEIAELIDSIKKHSDAIGSHKHIPQLELELILSKIKRLYEKSVVFNYLTSVNENKDRREDEIADDMIVVDVSSIPKAGVESPTPIVPHHPHEAPKEEAGPKLDKRLEPIVADIHEIPSPMGPPHQHGKNIKSLIGINEKFQFTKELFGNKPDSYNAAIDALNACESKIQVDNVLKDLSAKYSWKEDDKVVESFKSICHKKF